MQQRSEPHVQRRREPEHGVVRQVQLAHFEACVERALRRYLDRGLLGHGVARVRCLRRPVRAPFVDAASSRLGRTRVGPARG